MIQTIKRFETVIMETAQERVHLQECDGAGANERLYHHRLNISQSRQDPTLREVMLCHNHQSNLIETSLVGNTYSRLVSDFFSLTHFLQASSHFTKLKQVLLAEIPANTLVTVVASSETLQSQRETNFLDELMSLQYGVRRALAYHKRKDGDDDIELSLYERKVNAFKQMWNCDLFTSTGNYKHRCCRVGHPNNWCCQNDEESKQKMAKTLLALLTLPETPAPGKWTKLWSCLMFTAP